MANAQRDENRIPVILGTSNADGSTSVPIYANATDHTLSVHDGTTGSDSGNGNYDGNRVPVLFATSSADGVTPVAVYVDPATNKILVDSN
jgi:hypothetical protein